MTHESDEDEDYDDPAALNLDDDPDDRHWLATLAQLRVLAESAGLVLREGQLHAGR
jgi:hypothetical protein